jgi:hypothetical protein
MVDVVLRILAQCWLVLGQMAPYLLFGFLVAGVLSVCVRPAWVERHLGRPGFGPVLTASLVGVPLPLCSCGVIPVAASIRRHGASRAATAAFLLSTPQTGVDSIAVTYALLGPVFAVFRPIAALVTGLVGGLLVQLFDNSDAEAGQEGEAQAACRDACCSEQGSRIALVQAFRYGFVTLPKDIGAALLVGIVIAGLMAALLPQNQWQHYVGGGIVAILIMMAAGVPIYVCATASVPIAAGFMHVGASPGAALAFLIAGPATNAATLTTIWKVLGRRCALLYGLTVAGSAVGFGLLLDWIMPIADRSLSQLAGHVHGAAGPGWPTHVWAVVLLAVLAYSYLAPSRHGEEVAGSDASTSGAAAGEQQIEFSVTGMRCSHCAASVQRLLSEAPGVRQADVDLDAGRAVVRGERLDPGQLAAIITGLGYSAEVA